MRWRQRTSCFSASNTEQPIPIRTGADASRQSALGRHEGSVVPEGLLGPVPDFAGGLAPRLERRGRMPPLPMQAKLTRLLGWALAATRHAQINHDGHVKTISLLSPCRLR